MRDTDTRPAASCVAVTTSDLASGNLTRGCRSLFVGVGGTVVVVFPDGTTGTHLNVASGAVLPVQALRVGASSTATNILAYY